MKYFTKIFCVVALCLFGVLGTQAKVEQVHATFASPSNTNTTWTPDASGVTKGTFTWSTTYYNQLRNIGLPTGDITGYKKLVVDCKINSGNQFRILIYKGGSNLTLYASDGLNEFILADTLKALYPDTYNEFLLDCTEICLSGNNNAAPGEAVINDVYLETYNDEGEKVFATFASPSNTNTTWTPDTSGETAGTFTWSTTYYNQLRNIGLPSGDISGYKKLVVDTEIKSGNQFRILIYKGGSNLTLYASNGLNEFILADTLKALYPDTYNEFLLDCTEICLSGNNNAAPGEAVIKSVYLETYPENEVVDIPDIVYEEDPGVPEGDFVDFTEAFPEVQAKIGLGTDSHPIVLGNGDVVLGARSKNVIADLSAYSKFTMVTSPNLKLVLYMNHEVDAQQNAGDYSDADAGKYVFMDLQADENGLIEVDLTQFTKQDLNCLALPWDNNNKGTVWHLLLYKAPVVATHTWDFTQWSEATVTNLKAEAAKVTVEADPDKEGNTMCVDNGALWSDHEKKPGTSCDTYAASKDNCFWYMGGEAEPTANGEAVAEFAGLEFNTTYGASRALAIAVNYPSTSLGTYNGPAYLWFGGKNQTILTIKNVKPGTTITMGVESHKSSEGRGVKLFLDDNELMDPEGNAVSAPKTYTEQTWQVPVVDSEVVDIVVKNTNGCHIYFIDAEIGESSTTGINTVETSTVANGAIYNLAGQRVAQPAKGLFIINGKKVVIK